MQVQVDRKAVFKLLDTILPLWQQRKFPYNQKDAVVPQKLIPESIREDKLKLACFYFYACIYMRGGIVSAQAFRALLRMRRIYPDMFDPLLARWLTVEEVQQVLKKFIGWDSKAASINWVENSTRLVESWEGNPLNLVKGVRNYEEACRRIRNKRLIKDRKEAGEGGAGFRGFQYKMVSMLIYFFDWEGLLPKRFLYPSPADFHNFRLGIASGGIVVELEPGERLRPDRHLSTLWRAVIMEYLVERGADPLEVADALWLYSLVLCGNSPATLTRNEELLDPKLINGRYVRNLFHHHKVKEEWDHVSWAAGKKEKLLKTCLKCPFLGTCQPIPARPYYTSGELQIRAPLKLWFSFSPEDAPSSERAVNKLLTPHQHDFGFPIAHKPAEAP